MTLTVYILKYQTVAKVQMSFLFTPISQDNKEQVAEGKTFTEKFLLHRTVDASSTHDALAN